MILVIRSKIPLYKNHEEDCNFYHLAPTPTIVVDIKEYGYKDEKGEIISKLIDHWRCFLSKCTHKGCFRVKEMDLYVGLLVSDNKKFWYLFSDNSYVDIFFKFNHLIEWIPRYFRNEVGRCCEICNEESYKKKYPDVNRGFYHFIKKLNEIKNILLNEKSNT